MVLLVLSNLTACLKFFLYRFSDLSHLTRLLLEKTSGLYYCSVFNVLSAAIAASPPQQRRLIYHFPNALSTFIFNFFKFFCRSEKPFKIQAFLNAFRTYIYTLKPKINQDLL